MRITLSAVAVIALLFGSVSAQEEVAPSTISVSSYGETGDIVLGRLAENMGAKLHITKPAQAAMARPAWVVAEDVSHESAMGLMEEALRVELEVRHGVLFATGIDEVLRGSQTQGYDVSVLAGRYVEYVNAYGSPKGEEAEGDQHTAAEHLGSILDEVITRPGKDGPYASIVGDRVLYTMDAARHERVRETLDLLMAEGGGESGSLTAERALFEKLDDAQYEGEVTGTPISSVIARVCTRAGVPFILDAGFVEAYGDWHVDFQEAKAVSCSLALHKLLAKVEDDDVLLGSRNGALLVTLDPRQCYGSLKVVDGGILLKKLEASYQRQRTAPGKSEGFSGDLRSDGGIDVVLDAIYEQLDAGGRHADVLSYGARILIRGNHGEIDATVKILEEMGWEKPEQN